MQEVIARRVEDDRPIRVQFDDRIRAIEPVTADVLPDRYVCPGFVDLQVNGFGGVDFNTNTLSVAEAETAVRTLHTYGATRILATLITASAEDLRTRAGRLREAIDASPLVHDTIIGLHLEGPFIATDDGPRGAHPLAHCQTPSRRVFDAIHEASGRRIRLLTLAPERPGALDLIKALTRDGFVVALGHLHGDDAIIDAAVRAGASLSTHLGNATHERLPRLANYVQTQLADDRLQATFIADGFHIPPKTLKNFIRAKGIERSILITDAVVPAGAFEAFVGHKANGAEVTADGRIVLVGTQLLAGSTLTMSAGVANLARWTDCTRADAVHLATHRPADLIGRHDLGRLEVGAVADVLIVDWPDEMTVLETYIAGMLCYRRESAER
ncbi:MAG: amidohydrolase family protein [Phycisphaerae bacterium]|nr:amidohydrolase family protein [Phycisphaerae bacterium]